MRSQIKANFDSLPRELVFQIADHSDARSTFNLSASCKDMHAMLEETVKRKSSAFKEALPTDDEYKKYGFKDPEGYWVRGNGIEYDENREEFEDEHVAPGEDEPFAQAVRNGDFPKAQYYLQLGVDPNSHSLGGARMLSLAVHSRSTEMIQLLVSYGADINGLDFVTSMSALACAVYTQQPVIIQKLIELGVDVNKDGLAGYIAHTCSAEIMEIFLNANLDLNHLGRVVWTDHPAWEDENGWNVIHHLAARGDRDMWDILVPHLSADMVNACSIQDQTPLHLALEEGNPGLALELVRLGADVNARDGEGYSPLDCALLGGHLAVARLLIEAPGIKLGIEDENGYTELHTAIRVEELGIIRALLARGMKVRRGSGADTPLSCAIQTKRLDIVKILCEEAQDHPFMNGEDDCDEQADAVEEARELEQYEIATYLESIPVSSFKPVVRSGENIKMAG
jgi:ankyrin repeat protein